MPYAINHIDSQADPEFALGVVSLKMRLFSSASEAARASPGATAVPYALGWISKDALGNWSDSQGRMPPGWVPIDEFLEDGATHNARTEVLVGQVWKDTTHRTTPRHSRVVAIGERMATMTRCFGDGRSIGSQVTVEVLLDSLQTRMGWTLLPVEPNSEARQQSAARLELEKEQQRETKRQRIRARKAGLTR